MVDNYVVRVLKVEDSVNLNVKNRNMKRSAFTIVEIMIVVAIASLLAAIILPVFSIYRENIRYNSCVNNLKQIGVALNMYHSEYGSYPEQVNRDYSFYSLNSNADYVSETTRANMIPFSSVPSDMTGINYYEWLSVLSIENDVRAQVLDDNPTLGEDVPALNAEVSSQLAALLATTNSTPDDPYYYYDQNDIMVTNNNKSVAYRKLLISNENKNSRLKLKNYGLATLYELYLSDTKDYINSFKYFHCPSMFDTEKVDQRGFLALTADGGANRDFDPFLNGYNTYELTYNYNQFNNEIIAYNRMLGFGDTLDLNRQLSSKNPPADTVVCWCYGHSNSQSASVLPQNNSRIVYTGPNIDVRALERTRNKEVAVVLWLDGGVSKVPPKIAINKDENTAYFVPPYLYRRGHIK